MSIYVASNFHEDPSRHYLLKLERAKERGFEPNIKPKRKPSKATMMDILTSSDRLSQTARNNLQKQVGSAIPTDPIQALLLKISPEKRERLKKLLGR